MRNTGKSEKRHSGDSSDSDEDDEVCIISSHSLLPSSTPRAVLRPRLTTLPPQHSHSSSKTAKIVVGVVFLVVIAAGAFIAWKYGSDIYDDVVDFVTFPTMTTRTSRLSSFLQFASLTSLRFE